VYIIYRSSVNFINLRVVCDERVDKGIQYSIRS